MFLRWYLWLFSTRLHNWLFKLKVLVCQIWVHHLVKQIIISILNVYITQSMILVQSKNLIF